MREKSVTWACLGYFFFFPALVREMSPRSPRGLRHRGVSVCERKSILPDARLPRKMMKIRVFLARKRVAPKTGRVLPGGSSGGWAGRVLAGAGMRGGGVAVGGVFLAGGGSLGAGRPPAARPAPAERRHLRGICCFIWDFPQRRPRGLPSPPGKY